jgi:hypothetical protein
MWSAAYAEIGVAKVKASAIHLAADILIFTSSETKSGRRSRNSSSRRLLNLTIWNATIYCTLVVQDIVMVGAC